MITTFMSEDEAAAHLGIADPKLWDRVHTLHGRSPNPHWQVKRSGHWLNPWAYPKTWDVLRGEYVRSIETCERCREVIAKWPTPVPPTDEFNYY